MSSSEGEPDFQVGELDLWLFEEPGPSAPAQEDRAHRLKRLQLTVAELEGHAATAAAEGDDDRAEDLRKLANELREKHAKWDRRSGNSKPRWRHFFRRYMFDRRGSGS